MYVTAYDFGIKLLMSNNSGGSNQYIPIIVAAIGAAGVIIAAAINAWNNRASVNPTQSPLPSPAISQYPSSAPSSPIWQKPTDLPDGVFPYSGSTTWARFSLAPTEERKQSDIGKAIRKAFPNQLFEYKEPIGEVNPGSPAAMDLLHDRAVAFALISRKLRPDPEKDRDFKVIPIAKTFRVAAVHRDLNLPSGKSLTLQDLKDICNGVKKNGQILAGQSKILLSSVAM